MNNPISAEQFSTAKTPQIMQPQQAKRLTNRDQAWYRPIHSPEHGVYVVLLVAFLTGAAAAQQWTWITTLALLCAFLGFQAEHPLALQIRQRKTLKPRFLFWGGLYAGAASAIALYLYLHTPAVGWLYAAVMVALAVDAIAVYSRKQRALFNEWITFAAVCLAAPLAYITTVGTLSPVVVGLWGINALFFGGSIFTVKLRKLKAMSGGPGNAYHSVALLVTIGLYQWQLVPLSGVIMMAVALFKFWVVLWQRSWYCQTPIKNVAMIETTLAFLFLVAISLSLLPAHLPPFPA